MSSIVWEVVQKTNAQFRLQLAARALAFNVDPDAVRRIFDLSESEMQDLLDEAADQPHEQPR